MPEYRERTYRESFKKTELHFFQVVVKETDLYIGVPRDRFTPELAEEVYDLVLKARRDMEQYLQFHPGFKESLEPVTPDPDAPKMIRDMVQAAAACGVGPMAAVAGAFAQLVGRYLANSYTEVIVENGGDIYLQTTKPRLIGIFAGNSPFSGRIAVKVPPYLSPLGICTSSGTVGHSLSFGKADAVTVLAETSILADAVATATANKINRPEDLQAATAFAAEIKGVRGVLAIKNDKLAAWGEVELVPYS
ncbi:MAG: UPF0280 family protein [Peptococcaceae bacterium]|nr:UPF0280 family protein [Peptococcaceae bacterium]